MSLRQVTYLLARIRVSTPVQAQVSQLANQISVQRDFHSSSSQCKNFKNRIPNNLKIGLWRLENGVTPENHAPLKAYEVAKSGGRGPDGRIWVHKIGGGVKIKYRFVDYKKEGPKEGEPLVERINAIKKDDILTSNLAVAASGNRKRYILASENMKVGDLVRTSCKVTAMPVRAYEGDSHPVGSLPLGTLIYNIEVIPGEGGTIARAAGTSGVYVRRIGDDCVIRMPSKREIIVRPECMVTVGRVSNVDHHITKKMTTAGENRRRGNRPCSGLWQRKTGRFGRKIKAIKAPIDYLQGRSKEAPEEFKFNF